MTSAGHHHLLYAELAKLLHAGFPVERAADTLLAQRPSPKRRHFLLALKDGLARRQTIAESVRDAVSGMEFSLLDAAERGGRLADGCAHLADYFRLVDQTRRRVLSKMIYPALLLHLVVLPVALPKFFVEGPGAFLKALLLPLGAMWAGAAVIILGARWLLRTARTDSKIDRLLLGLPIVGRVRQSLALARFSKVFQISLLAGQRISESLDLSAGAAQSGALTAAARSVARRVKDGEELGPALQSTPGIPGDLADAFATAEAAGTLDVEAGRWAGYLQADAEAAADRFAEWLPRLIYGVAVIVVAWVVIRFWLGYFNTIGEMMKIE